MITQYHEWNNIFCLMKFQVHFNGFKKKCSTQTVIRISHMLLINMGNQLLILSINKDFISRCFTETILLRVAPPANFGIFDLMVYKNWPDSLLGRLESVDVFRFPRRHSIILNEVFQIQGIPLFV